MHLVNANLALGSLAVLAQPSGTFSFIDIARGE